MFIVKTKILVCVFLLIVLNDAYSFASVENNPKKAVSLFFLNLYYFNVLLILKILNKISRNGDNRDLVLIEESNEDNEISEIESKLMKFLEILSKKKIQQEFNEKKIYENALEAESEESELKLSKRNPEFTNSLMMYSKLFRKLDRIGRRR
jgi:hypothetical protein